MDGLYSKSFMRFFYSKLLSCVSFLFRFPLRYSDFIYYSDGFLREIFLLENSLIDFGCSERDFNGSDCVGVWIGLFIVML